MTRHPASTDAPRSSLIDDSGVAMLIVLAWSMLLMGFALVVGQAVVRTIRPSAHSEYAYAALAAAQAGVDDYRARLLKEPTYYLDAHSDNLALSQYTEVPGGASDAEFRYAVDASKAGAGGEVHVFVTGRSPKGAGGVTRSLEATYSKRSTLDYVYLSDIETTAPNLPNAYSTELKSGGDFQTAQQLAAVMCSRYWYKAGAVGPATSAANVTSGTYPQGNSRNQRFCAWAGISTTERLLGYVHTNDIWRFYDTSTYDFSGTFENGKITSSCPASQSSPLVVGCPMNSLPTPPHRYMSSGALDGVNNTGTSGGTWSSSKTYGDAAVDPATRTDAANDTATSYLGTRNTQRNPGWDTVLDLPLTPALLKRRASEIGCIYTGPTRIRFVSDGTMWVTSPDTKVTGPWCDGTATGTSFAASTATAQVTKKVDLSKFHDLVIYVQNVPRTGATDDPNNAYDVNNIWAAGTDPGCAVKNSPLVFPYVIPNTTASGDTGELAYFVSPLPTGGPYRGFPSQWADPASPWYGYSGSANLCGNADVYVQGQYKGAVTIAAENNIAITSDLTDSTSPLTGASGVIGKPSSASTSTLGLVGGKFTYLYRPYEASHTAWARDWKSANADSPIINAAILAIDQCWGSQDPYYPRVYVVPRNDNEEIATRTSIYLWGSLAQHYRCTVGSATGYDKDYRYDERLRFHTPPYMLELSNEPWRDGRLSEFTPQSQTYPTTKTYALTLADESTSTVSDVSVSAGPATRTWPGSSTVNVTTTGPGIVVVTYDVTASGSTIPQTRRLVIDVQ
jgi:hypothetical protein